MKLIPPGEGVTYAELREYLNERAGVLLDRKRYKRLIARAGVTLRQHPDPKVRVGIYDRFTDDECMRIIREFWRARGEHAMRGEKNAPADDHPRRGQRKAPTGG